MVPDALGWCRLRAAVETLRLAPWLTHERVLRWGWGFTVLSLVLLAWDVTTHMTAGVTNADGEHLGRDFVNLWSGVRLVESDNTELAYDVEAFHRYQKALVGPASEFKLYGYPPSTMLLFHLVGHQVALVLLWLAVAPVAPPPVQPEGRPVSDLRRTPLLVGGRSAKILACI
jgi:hypothetical protein